MKVIDTLLQWLGRGLRALLRILGEALGEMFAGVLWALAGVALMVGATLLFGSAGLIAATALVLLWLLWRTWRSDGSDGSGADDDGGGDAGGD